MADFASMRRFVGASTPQWQLQLAGPSAPSGSGLGGGSQVSGPASITGPASTRGGAPPAPELVLPVVVVLVVTMVVVAMVVAVVLPPLPAVWTTVPLHPATTRMPARRA